jgi:hypothetical protein
VWTSYSEADGKKTHEESYKNGEKNGVWKYYYPGGAVVANEHTYKNNVLDGKSATYTRKGKPETEIHYKENTKHGDFKVFNSKGDVAVHQVYENGVKAKDIINNIDYKKKAKQKAKEKQKQKNHFKNKIICIFAASIFDKRTD